MSAPSTFFKASSKSTFLVQYVILCIKYYQSSQRVWAKKNTRKKRPFLRKKTQFQQKKHFLALYLFLKGYFVYLFYTKYPPFNVFKNINYLFLFFNNSKTSYFTKQQTPLMIIISHNFKEMIFFIRID